MTLKDGSSQRRKEPIQLFRPKSNEHLETIKAMLNGDSITEQDIHEFVATGTTTKVKEMEKKGLNKMSPHEEAFKARRKQIREWAKLVETGEAHFDPETERLVPTPARDNAERPDRRMPPINLQPLQPNNNDPNANEEEERRWLDHEEREASEAIARAVRRYQEKGVPESEYELIPLSSTQRDPVNLTCRRIFFAVLAVITAFICIMLQTMPLMGTSSPSNPIFDKLLFELLHVKHFSQHARECDSLNRDESPGWRIPLLWASNPNCNDGVLHLPARSVLGKVAASPVVEYKEGVNVSWSFPCNPPDNESSLSISSCFSSLDDKVCRNKTDQCFRGVHDGIIGHTEVFDALKTAERLISTGGDHIQIHDDVSTLNEELPSIVEKLRQLLVNDYGVVRDVAPVAFRISAALPLDAKDVNLYSKSSDVLTNSFNRSVYIEWLEAIKRQNEVASFPLPPPFATKSFRDPCRLLSDQEADPRFAIHTSVFLSEGAGGQYTGGAALYVDDHRSNANPRRKIRRGLTVDGSRGRIIVSTGGVENRRCRLPTRSGVRAVLQIWWACTAPL